MQQVMYSNESIIQQFMCSSYLSLKTKIAIQNQEHRPDLKRR